MARGYMKVTKKIASYLLMIPLVFIWTMPLYWLVHSSFMGIEDMFRNPPVWIPTRRRFEDYRDALTALPFVWYFPNTVLTVCFNVMGILVNRSLSVYDLSRVRWNYRDTVSTILMSTMILPYFVTLIPNFTMWKKLRFVNTSISMIVSTWFCMGIASVYGGGMFNIFLLRQFIRTIPKELDETASVGGAGHWAIFTQITLPLPKLPLICAGLFTLLNSRDDLINSLTCLNSGKKYTIQLSLHTFTGYFNAEWHLMMTAACVAVIPVVLVFLVGQKYFVEGVATTGLKG